MNTLTLWLVWVKNTNGLRAHVTRRMHRAGTGRTEVIWGTCGCLCCIYLFFNLSAPECLCVCVCLTERERGSSCRGPPGCRKRQTQLDASGGGQDVLTTSWGRWGSRSGSAFHLQCMWISPKMAQLITSGFSVIYTFQGFAEKRLFVWWVCLQSREGLCCTFTHGDP